MHMHRRTDSNLAWVSMGWMLVQHNKQYSLLLQTYSRSRRKNGFRICSLWWALFAFHYIFIWQITIAGGDQSRPVCNCSSNSCIWILLFWYLLFSECAQRKTKHMRIQSIWLGWSEKHALATNDTMSLRYPAGCRWLLHVERSYTTAATIWRITCLFFHVVYSFVLISCTPNRIGCPHLNSQTPK